MADFLTLILAFPTVVFTVLLGIVLVFWSISLVAGLDIDGFDFDFDGGDADLSGDLDADADVHGEGLLGIIGLAGVPITIAISLIAFFGWIAAVLLSGWVLPVAGAGVLASVGVLIGAFLIALPPAALCARPMKRLFITHGALDKETLVGQTCEIKSNRVTDGFGQAELHDGGAGLLLDVRCSRANSLARGSVAVIFDYDSENDVFQVAPVEASAAGTQ